MKNTLACLTVLMALLTTACDLDNAEQAAPEGNTIVLTANPLRLPADGRSTAEIAALVYGENGAVEDNTVVHFTAVMGSIPARAETRGGVAANTFTAGTRYGTAIVTAVSGAATAALEIELGGGAGAITLYAEPSRFQVRDGGWHVYTSRLIATVWDEDNLPLAGSPVVFRTDRGDLASRGVVLYTDAQGQASDSLRLELKLDEGDVMITSVECASGKTTALATVTVERGW